MRFLYVSAGVERLNGLTAAEVLVNPSMLYSQIVEGDRLKVAAAEEESARNLSPLNIIVQTRHPDSQLRWMHLSSSPRHLADGRILWDGIEIDITERKLAEKAIQTSFAEKEVLLREIYHRTKNNLQVVCSLLNLQSARVSDPLILKAFQDTGNRIQSMALVHEKLYQSKDLSHIDLKDYIKDLANFLLVNYQTEPGKISLQLDLQSVIVNIDTTMPCGLMLNEILSNAIKYAFPAGRQGTISIFLSSWEDGGIELKVADDGVGLPSELDIWNADSLGLKLVISLAQSQLKGKLEVRREQGTEFRLLFRELDYKPRI
jgi:PAS domain S-box-containing protein